MPLVATLLLGLVFSGPSTEDVNRAVKDVFSDEELVREFPTQDDPIRNPPEPIRIPGLEYILWAALIVCVVFVIVALVRRFAGYQTAADPDPPTVIAGLELRSARITRLPR